MKFRNRSLTIGHHSSVVEIKKKYAFFINQNDKKATEWANREKKEFIINCFIIGTIYTYYFSIYLFGSGYQHELWWLL